MSNQQKFGGKVAFITGGGTGIGRATALALARDGASVAIVGHTPEHIEEVVALIEEQGGRAIAITCDVSDADQVKAAVEQTVEAFGRLDFAFNNAGVEQPVKPLDQVSARTPPPTSSATR
jgi:NAD(P)-dependent dehydrogenase (short-subunit alcohol dehydrogenase family)